jgi:hypothetical protein
MGVILRAAFFCSPKNLHASFNLGQLVSEILRFAQDDKLNPSTSMFDHVRLHRIKRVRPVGKAFRGKMPF